MLTHEVAKIVSNVGGELHENLLLFYTVSFLIFITSYYFFKIKKTRTCALKNAFILSSLLPFGILFAVLSVTYNYLYSKESLISTFASSAFLMPHGILSIIMACIILMRYLLNFRAIEWNSILTYILSIHILGLFSWYIIKSAA